MSTSPTNTARKDSTLPGKTASRLEVSTITTVSPKTIHDSSEGIPSIEKEKWDAKVTTT